MTIQVPYGYRIYSFRDYIVALPYAEPAYRPKIWNSKTKRWNLIKWTNKNIKKAIEFEQHSNVYHNHENNIMSFSEIQDPTKWA